MLPGERILVVLTLLRRTRGIFCRFSRNMHAVAADGGPHVGSMLVSASKFCFACLSMFSEKSVAMTPAKRPDFAKRRAKRPLPQLRSTRTCGADKPGCHRHQCRRSTRHVQVSRMRMLAGAVFQQELIPRRRRGAGSRWHNCTPHRHLQIPRSSRNHRCNVTDQCSCEEALSSAPQGLQPESEGTEAAPGKPAHEKPCRQPRSYTKLTMGLLRAQTRLLSSGESPFSSRTCQAPAACVLMHNESGGRTPEDLSAGCGLLAKHALLGARRDGEVYILGVGVERPSAAAAAEALD